MEPKGRKKKGIKLQVPKQKKQKKQKKEKPVIFATKNKARRKKPYLKRTILERKNVIVRSKKKNTMQ